TERRFGKLEALLAVADRDTSLIVSGTGEVIEPEDGIIAIGSGSSYALSAAHPLLAHTQLDARTIATEALAIAGDICIYTIRNVVVEELCPAARAAGRRACRTPSPTRSPAAADRAGARRPARATGHPPHHPAP